MAGLVWERTQVEVAATQPGQAEITGEFVFTNAGSVPVRIRSVQTSCSCTTAAWDRTAVEPGGQGKIRMTFDVGRRQGRRATRVVVETDQRGAAPVELLFVVNIPVPVQIEPRLLLWTAEEPRTPKQVRVELAGQPPARVVGVVCDNPAFRVSEERQAGDRRMTITVAPPEGPGPAKGRLEVRLDPPLTDAMMGAVILLVR